MVCVCEREKETEREKKTKRRRREKKGQHAECLHNFSKYFCLRVATLQGVSCCYHS